MAAVLASTALRSSSRLPLACSADLPALPVALFLFVCVQGAFGAWTVTLKLQPLIVTIHLLLGMGLLAMLAWLGEKWLEPRTYRYRLEGADRADANVIRLD